MKIEFINTADELKSFPLDGKLYIKSDVLLEDAMLNDSISVFRMTDEQGLFNFGDKYNQSIGYVRENFNTEKIKITQSAQSDGFLITLENLSKYHPNSNYGLFIDKRLSTEFLSTNKIISKSNSDIRLEFTNSANNHLREISLEIISEPFITSTANILTVKTLQNAVSKTYTLNLKTNKNYIDFDNIRVYFNDEPYVLGELFNIIEIDSEKLDNNLFYSFTTSLSKDNIQIPLEEDSKRLSAQDVLDYYEQQDQSNTVTIIPLEYQEQDKGIITKYLGYNKILVVLPEGILTDMIDFNSTSFEVSEAFDLYTLEQYGYYDPNKSYNITYDIKNESSFIIAINEV